MTPERQDLTPDEIEQLQSDVPDEDEVDVADLDRLLTPDEIEQRMEVGWDDHEPAVDTDEW